MKTRFDPRHQQRIKLMQSLFAWEVDKNQSIEGVSPSLIEQVDELISQFAPKWSLESINKLDLAILRLAFIELSQKPQTPPKVVIDESVELAKEFGSDNSSGFINGVLGSWYKQHVTTDPKTTT